MLAWVSPKSIIACKKHIAYIVPNMTKSSVSSYWKLKYQVWSIDFAKLDLTGDGSLLLEHVVGDLQILQLKLSKPLLLQSVK